MRYLVFVTVLWAFSFSLIGEYLAGRVDSYFAVLTRILLAGALFLPLLRWRGLAPGLVAGILLTGALQFGITYVCLYLSFEYLSVPEVLLFTITTPLYVALIDEGLKGRFTPVPLVSTALAVVGAGIIRYDNISDQFLLGFLILQLANATFAAGQVGYAHLVRPLPSGGPPVPQLWPVLRGGLDRGVACLPAAWGWPTAARRPHCNGACWSGWGWLPRGWGSTCGTGAQPWWMGERWGS